MILEETYELNNGVAIPRLGYGTWMIEDARAADAVSQAIAAGYRHIDTAQAYGNESGVGDGIRASGVVRSELFITSKLAAEIKSYKEAVDAIDGSLQTMGLDMIDMMIIHSPQPWADFRGGDYSEGNLEAWRALEEAQTAGKLRAIGVSNFLEADLDNIVNNASVVPAVNQVLAHIGNMPFALIDHAKKAGILTEAYSPFGHGAIIGNDQIAAIASRYDVGVPQLCIRYLLQLGLLPLPKTATPAHMRSNADVDFTISDDDMATLNAMKPLKDYGEASHFPVYAKS